MRVNDTYFIDEKRDGIIVTNIIDDTTHSIDSTNYNYQFCKDILRVLKKRTISNSTKNAYLTSIYGSYGYNSEDFVNSRLIKTAENEEGMVEVDREKLKDLSQRLIDFFSEFQVPISIRFVDTFIRQINKASYVISYFKLYNSPWLNEIVDKVKSVEFDSMVDLAKEICPTMKPTQVNNHFKVYFGPAGTGKTTQACNEATVCIPCSSDMDCRELLKVFSFEDGKATFKKSDFWLAIEQGKTVVLDEVNLLNRQVLQFLQALTDGKDYVDFEGTRINIHPKFMAIGTMNLFINGMALPLSEPLVDRCSEIKEFKLSANDIVNALT